MTRPVLKPGRLVNADLKRVPVDTPPPRPPTRAPADPLAEPGGGRVTLPALAVASLLVHAAVIGVVIVDFRPVRLATKRPLTPAVEVEMVDEPLVLRRLKP